MLDLENFSMLPHRGWSSQQLQCLCMAVVRWNFSVGQHDVSFVSRKPAGFDSRPHGQYHDRISAHSSHDVDPTCTRSSASSRVRHKDVQGADEEDESSDQCEVQSQSF